MSVIGIVSVKEKSSRFPFKNIYKIKGTEMFLQNVEQIFSAGYECYVATNSKIVKDICSKRNIKSLWRGDNISNSEQSIFEVAKWALQSLPEKYEIVIIALANVINLKASDVIEAVTFLERENLQEVRSYDSNGKENGLIIMRADYLLNRYQFSCYMGAITTEAKEIHYKHELE